MGFHDLVWQGENVVGMGYWIKPMLPDDGYISLICMAMGVTWSAVHPLSLRPGVVQQRICQSFQVWPSSGGGVSRLFKAGW